MRPSRIRRQDAIEFGLPRPEVRLHRPLVGELRRIRAQNVAHHLPRNTQLSADRFDRLLLNNIGTADLRDRLHKRHPDLGFHDNMEASVDPRSRGPDWPPITPKTRLVNEKSARQSHQAGRKRGLYAVVASCKARGELAWQRESTTTRIEG